MWTLLRPSVFPAGDDGTTETAVRELVYLERCAVAAQERNTASDQLEDWVPSRRGLLIRKPSRMDQAIQFYQLAIDKYPSDLFVRSH
jgi:hypothetical protein